jgi:hypothetical protein
VLADLRNFAFGKQQDEYLAPLRPVAFPGALLCAQPTIEVEKSKIAARANARMA